MARKRLKAIVLLQWVSASHQRMCRVAIKQQLKQPLSQGLIDSKINHYVPEIILRLVEIFDPEKIFLFGSYALGIPNKV